MKRKLLIVAAVLLFLYLAVFIWLGFFTRSDVYLTGYTLSDDGKEIIMDVSIVSSMGYTRGYKCEEKGDEKFLSFYNAFGGFNSSVGAKSRFEIEADCSRIYFKQLGTFRPVLEKNAETGQWEKVQ